MARSTKHVGEREKAWVQRLGGHSMSAAKACHAVQLRGKERSHGTEQTYNEHGYSRAFDEGRHNQCRTRCGEKLKMNGSLREAHTAELCNCKLGTGQSCCTNLWGSKATFQQHRIEFLNRTQETRTQSVFAMLKDSYYTDQDVAGKPVGDPRWHFSVNTDLGHRAVCKEVFLLAYPIGQATLTRIQRRIRSGCSMWPMISEMMSISSRVRLHSMNGSLWALSDGILGMRNQWVIGCQTQTSSWYLDVIDRMSTRNTS